jgi:hypothetical protein
VRSPKSYPGIREPWFSKEIIELQRANSEEVTFHIGKEYPIDGSLREAAVVLTETVANMTFSGRQTNCKWD